MNNSNKYHEHEMDENNERPEWDWIIKKSLDEE